MGNKKSKSIKTLNENKLQNDLVSVVCIKLHNLVLIAEYLVYGFINFEIYPLLTSKFQNQIPNDLIVLCLKYFGDSSIYSSKIITNYQQHVSLMSILKYKLNVFIAPFRFNLLYTGSTNIFNKKIFHSKCDFRDIYKCRLTLVQTNAEYFFGLFQKIDSHDVFVFNINSEKIVDLDDGDTVIDYGFAISVSNLHILSENAGNIGYYDAGNIGYYTPFDDICGGYCIEHVDGDRYIFHMKEIEVFELDLNNSNYNYNNSNYFP